MKTLVIYAHPDTGGHCAAMLSEARNVLIERKEDFEILDLYKMKYDPVLSAEEHYTRGQKKMSSQNIQIQKKVAEADRMLFIYPIWWGSMPAILKGFCDRVFTSGFGFRYEHGMPKGLLKGKRATIFITSGSPPLFSRIFQGSRPQKSLAADLLGFCGVKAKVFQLGGCNRFDETREKLAREFIRKKL